MIIQECKGEGVPAKQKSEMVYTTPFCASEGSSVPKIEGMLRAGSGKGQGKSQRLPLDAADSCQENRNNAKQRLLFSTQYHFDLCQYSVHVA